MRRGFLLLMALVSMAAQSMECAELEELLGENSKEKGLQQAVAQEEFAYFSALYQLQAQLKTALLERSMLEAQAVPNLDRLRQVVQRVNDLRLQMDLADLQLQGEVRSILSLDKYKQWRATWEPMNVCEAGLTAQEAQWSALASLLKELLAQRASCEPESYTQQLPQRSMQRALGR